MHVAKSLKPFSNTRLEPSGCARHSHDIDTLQYSSRIGPKSPRPYGSDSIVTDFVLAIILQAFSFFASLFAFNASHLINMNDTSGPNKLPLMKIVLYGSIIRFAPRPSCVMKALRDSRIPCTIAHVMTLTKNMKFMPTITLCRCTMMYLLTSLRGRIDPTVNTNPTGKSS